MLPPDKKNIQEGLDMKKVISIFLAIILLLGTVSVCAEGGMKGMLTYSDEQYSFIYPETWSQDTAENGDIILMNPGQTSAIMTFSLYIDALQLTGDPDEDRNFIDNTLSTYTEEAAQKKGKNITLNGTVEGIVYGNLKGFRAYGSWLSNGDKLIMDILTADNYMVSFTCIGEKAITLEEVMLNSVELQGSKQEDRGDMYTRWKGTKITFLYPKQYSALEQTTGVLLADQNAPNNVIAVRIYDVDFDYSKEMATTLATQSLPKSTKIEADAEMVVVGDWDAAVIKGESSAGKIAYYVIGSGRTVLGIIFMGEEAIGYAQIIIASMKIM